MVWRQNEFQAVGGRVPRCAGEAAWLEEKAGTGEVGRDREQQEALTFVCERLVKGSPEEFKPGKLLYA